VTPAFEALLDQALQLGEEERGELAARLLRSLEPDDGDALTPSEWEAAWAVEIDRRVREVREGRGQLVDGDDVMAELREIARRP
jgi:putative addiction module component (TIGR02574 family)